MKTVQELMRHANSRLTLDVYAQALTPAKRAAHLKVVEMIKPSRGEATCSLVFPGRVGPRLQVIDFMERPIGIEPTPEPWQGSVLPLY